MDSYILVFNGLVGEFGRSDVIRAAGGMSEDGITRLAGVFRVNTNKRFTFRS